MARVRVNVGTNFNEIDLYWYRRHQVDADAEKNTNFVYNGVTYPDTFYVNGKDGSEIMSLTFGAYDLAYTSNGQITGGRVTGILEQDLVSGIATLIIEGIDVSAVAIFNAYRSSSNADDLALLESAFSGNDEFFLSEERDVMNGFRGNDRMFGYGGDDTLYGGEGADLLDGGSGSNILYGGLGNDILLVRSIGDTIIEYANEGFDIVRSAISYTLGANLEVLELYSSAPINGTGNDADNYIVGTNSDNVLEGRGGDDILVAYSGNDIMRGGVGNDTYYVHSTSQQVSELAGQGYDDVLSYVSYTLPDHVEDLELLLLNGPPTSSSAREGTGNALDNWITGNSLANVLRGLDGDDTLIGEEGDDLLIGGSGADDLRGGDGFDTVSYAAATAGVTVNLLGAGTPGEDSIEGVESVIGSAHADRMIGSLTGDRLAGGEGGDVLLGLYGTDTLLGEGGDDVLSGGHGADRIEGGAGRDVLFAHEQGDAAFGGDEGGNELLGGDGNDILVSWNSVATGNDDILTGGAGADRFYVDTYVIDRTTGARDRIMDFSDGDIASTRTSADPGRYFVFSGATLTVVSYSGADGKLGEFQFSGQIVPGNLQLYREQSPFDAGDLLSVRYTTDRIAEAYDWAREMEPYLKILRGQVAKLVVELGSEAAARKLWAYFKDKLSPDGALTIALQEAVKKATPELSFADAKQNEEIRKQIVDKLKSEILSSLTKTLNEATDSGRAYSSGDLFDTAVDGLKAAAVFFPVVSPVVKALEIGEKVISGFFLAADLYLASQDVEILRNTPDTEAGTIDPRVIRLDTGTQSLIQRASDMSEALGSAGEDNVYSTVGLATLAANVENATLLNGENGAAKNGPGEAAAAEGPMVALGGNALANVLTGNDQANAIEGRGGDDRLTGGGGNDRIDGGDGTDTVVLRGIAGDYAVRMVDGTMVIEDLVAGRDGQDVLIGIERVAFADGTVDAATLASGAATVRTGTNGDDGIGAAGLTGSVDLRGLAGNDTLIGGSGNDILRGDSGLDAMRGGLGNDRYLVDRQDDLIFEDADGGHDTAVADASFYLYANVEDLILLDGTAFFGVGNALGNLLLGNAGGNLLLGGAGDDRISGGAGIDLLWGEDGADQLFGDADNDVLVGGGGNDRLFGGEGGDGLYGEDGDDVLTGGDDFVFDQLVGGAGNDQLFGNSGRGDFDYLFGGTGDDQFWVDTPADLVFEDADGGTDTVYADIAGAGYYLFGGIENLVLQGATPFGVGNALANRITGNDIGNYLLGGAGDDVLDGRGGNDVLFGEAGADRFVFTRGTGGDVIGDFQAGTDRIDLSAFGFASFAAVQAAMGDNGGTAFINLGNGDFIVLNGVAKAALGAGDFIL
ncbi:calcium-binding protein [Sphingomonas sp. CJ99]